jgi:hypothetical protein
MVELPQQFQCMRAARRDRTLGRCLTISPGCCSFNEIDTMAAFLLREGRAITPADALAKATITIHQKRRDAASARVPAHDHMGKTLAAEGGPLSGQGAPQ